MSKDPRVDAYIATTAPFARPILESLRSTIREAVPGVEETIKWGGPFFEYHGVLCGLAGFKAHCAFIAWRARGTGKAQRAGNQNRTAKASAKAWRRRCHPILLLR